MANQSNKGNAAPGATNTPGATTETTKTKSERFKELAPKRTRAVLKQLEILGNCSNKAGYDYTPEDVAKIFGAIEKKVADTKALYSAVGKTKDISFSL